MSGHSKWKTIQHKKGAADAKRGKMFSKISKELMVAVKKGGPDPSANPTLRTIIQKGKSINMPADNIERAIKKAAGGADGTSYEEVVYEGYANGIALIVKVLTDNKNRAAAEIRHIFNKHGSDFAAQGAVTRGFERKGQIFVDASSADEDTLMGIVLDAGAEDMSRDGDQFEVLTDISSFSNVTEALEKKNILTVSAEISMVPTSYVPVADKATASSILKFVGDLEENDDVQGVYTNMDMDDSVLKELEKD